MVGNKNKTLPWTGQNVHYRLKMKPVRLVAMNFGRSVKIALINRGHSQKWLAGQLGVTDSHVSALCCGHKRPGWGKAQRIADLLGYRLSELIALGED